MSDFQLDNADFSGRDASGPPEKRYYVVDRKVGPADVHFNAENQRFWVIDRTTSFPIDEFTTRYGADRAARQYNLEA